MHEIITLQLGHRANYLATHFWNTQESYFTYSASETSPVDHNILFRPGIGADGVETFTPRTVIYDLKGGFGSLRKINALYETEHGATTAAAGETWSGRQSVVKQYEQPIEPSRYQEQLEMGLPTFQVKDGDVRYWSDFNRLFYHPRSAVQISQFELGSELMPFERWGAGEELWEELDKGVDLLDRDVRPWAEECDSMQGVQVLSGVDDAWGGFASRYVDGLRDEYGEKMSVWVWGVEDTRRVGMTKRRIREANKARSLARLGKSASAYVRLANLPDGLPGYVNLGREGDWRTTALMCSAFESVTLPARLLGARQTTLSWLEDSLNTNGSQRLFDLQFGLDPAQIQHANGTTNGTPNGVQSHAEDSLPASEASDLDLSFLSGEDQVQSSGHIFAQSNCRRSEHDDAGVEDADPEERLRRRLNEETIVEHFHSSLLFPMVDAFPDDLFRTKSAQKHLALTSALSTNAIMKGRVTELRDKTMRGLDLDEREGLYNDMTDLANGYIFGWESSSDSGEDT